MSAAIETKDLRRVFRRRSAGEPGPRSKSGSGPREFAALDGVSVTIPRGELFGLLGPNGAGKTTLIKILCTLLSPSSGTARVAGFDVNGQEQEVRERINMVAGTERPGYGILTVRENLWFFSQLYGIPSAEAKRRAAELLDQFGLTKWADTKLHKLSSGLKQRLGICRGFITDPEVLFLDEPTLGLDVSAARMVRSFVRGWLEEDRNRTVLLTTHYMAEADELCDRVAVIDGGKLLAVDPPARLKARLATATVLDLVTGPIAAERFRSIPGVSQCATTDDPARGRTNLHFQLQGEEAIPEILDRVARAGSRVFDLRRTEPTLEDVFLSLVGRPLAPGSDQPEEHP